MTDARSTPLTRRGFLAGGAALATLPFGAYRALGQKTQTDVVVIGAGAAGIAAARALAEAGLSYTLLEAGDQAGGRAVTDTALFGVPFDMGAQRLFDTSAQPLEGLGRAAGLTLSPVPDGGRLYLDHKEAGDSAYEEFVAAVRRAARTIAAAGDAGRDIPAARVMPDLGPWAQTARFVAGPLFCAKDLKDVSTIDYAHAAPRLGALACREGLGTLVARLAAPLTISFKTAARAVETSRRRVTVETSRGTLQARAAIIAVPPSMVTSGKLRIRPDLGARFRTAFDRITLGAYDHIAFELPPGVTDLRPDEFIYFKTEGPHPFALAARIGGTALHTLEVAGPFAAELAQAGAKDGPKAARAFVEEAVTQAFGGSVARRIGRVHATAWTRAPYALGAFSCALPGGGHLRQVFQEVVSDRLAFAGEHTHESLWGTLGGAWLSGERAAGQLIAILKSGRDD